MKIMQYFFDKIEYCITFATPIYEADVAELVDALDLGSSAARREGSSPSFRTLILKPPIFLAVFFLI